MEWQPISTVPSDGFFLIYEDGAVRLKLRIGGRWSGTAIPALVSEEWGDAIVGADVGRIVKGYRLEDRDRCCEEPTHWMRLPPPPISPKSSN